MSLPAQSPFGNMPLQAIPDGLRVDSHVTIRFVTDDSLISRLIRAGEYGYLFTHAEAVIPPRTYEEPNLGLGGYLGAHYDGGVQLRPTAYDNKYNPQETFQEVKCSAKQSKTFYQFLKTKLGMGYDLKVIEELAIGAVIGEQDWRSKDKYICSELMTEALQEAKILPKLADNAGHITPRDLILILSALPRG